MCLFCCQRQVKNKRESSLDARSERVFVFLDKIQSKNLFWSSLDVASKNTFKTITAGKFWCIFAFDN